MNIINPATEDVLDEVPEDTPRSIAAKLAKARQAQREWARTPLERRLEAIRRFGDLLAEQRPRLEKTLTAEVGKPIAQSTNEIKGMEPRIDFFLKNTRAVLLEETVFENDDERLQEIISHEPLGVIANVSAWNYPYYVGSNVFLPALLAGNAVLYKPSEHATLTGQAIAKLLRKADVPADVFIPVIGGGEVGAELVRQPVDGVFFTGSYATGKRVSELVAGRMIKIQMELGGKDPVYVCDDVDVETAAVAVADGAFYNTGQSCCAVERIYVHRRIYARFVEAFVQTVKNFILGDPVDPTTYLGPVTRANQLKVLRRQVVDAEAKGATLFRGGQRLPERGYFFEPRVLTDVNHSMEIMREETFGPAIGIQRVTGDAEAVALMNDTEYGLTAGVYSPDRKRAVKILSEINSGTAYWNCCDRVSPRLPWSGRGHSGVGVTLSTYGIQTFLQPKAWHLRK
ncbi:MAG TPA: aldehyde dehydrogenase family protein [Planctomycetota bacterium]|nr:aldehyde dehydrogenase family protein [Planctomycetota bacterium]